MICISTVNMGKISYDTKQRIVTLYKGNNRPHQIYEILLSEGIHIASSSVRRIVALYKKGEPLGPKIYKKRYGKVTEDHQDFMKEHFKIWRNRQHSLRESVKIMKDELGVNISRSTLSRHKIAIGCPMGPVDERPMTRDKNKPRRKKFAFILDRCLLMSTQPER